MPTFVWTTRHTLSVAAALAGVLAVGELMPRVLVREDLSRYASNPPSLEVARAAQAMARAQYGSTIDRLLYPATRVDIGVWPANCPRSAKAEAVPHREYFTRVHMYTLFAMAGPVVEVRCGGTLANWEPEA